jgi:hypothetical protein
MPTRKQRRRAAKERRHEYETVWVDDEGNELEEPPEEAVAETRQRRDDGKAKAKPSAKTQQRGGRSVRVPPEPSWRRSLRRSIPWAVVLIALLVWLQSHAKSPNYAAIVPVGALYVLLFPVFTYYVDRTLYRRYLAKQQKADAAKKR